MAYLLCCMEREFDLNELRNRLDACGTQHEVALSSGLEADGSRMTGVDSG